MAALHCGKVGLVCMEGWMVEVLPTPVSFLSAPYRMGPPALVNSLQYTACKGHALAMQPYLKAGISWDQRAPNDS